MIPVPIGRCEFDHRNDAVSRFFVFHFLVSDLLSFLFLKNDKRKPIWWRSKIEKGRDELELDSSQCRG